MRAGMEGELFVLLIEERFKLLDWFYPKISSSFVSKKKKRVRNKHRIIVNS